MSDCNHTTAASCLRADECAECLREEAKAPSLHRPVLQRKSCHAELKFMPTRAKAKPAAPTRVGSSVVVRLRVCPTSLAEANAYVIANHRHHDPVTGHKFSISVADEQDRVRGVAIVGRPVSRHMDDGMTLEVNRCCTDGTRNACSMLYRAAWRAASAMGYRRMITYTLPEEGGGSLKGAGFKLVGERGGGAWTRKNRPRIDTHPQQTKWLWELADTSAKQPNVRISDGGQKASD